MLTTDAACGFDADKEERLAGVGAWEARAP